jgi:RNA polymerase sigma factor (sigma-70 family)
MANRVSAATMEGICTLFQWGAMGNWTDDQLVAHFLKGEEASEAAFRVLIHRHGPMVMGVCRRVLGDEHCAEDAFQTTFLVLVKKAGALRDCTLLTNWLYGVALRVANKERVKGARRRSVERQAAERATGLNGSADHVELRLVIDDEIRRLPERYRVPLVLCHIQGLRHDEVARRLGCPVGTIESRLSRAREQLRNRLARRGLAPSSSVLGSLLRVPAEPAVLQPSVEATVRAVFHVSSPQSTVGVGTVSAPLGMKLVFGFIPTLHAFAVALTLVVAAGVTLMGSVVYRAYGEPATLNAGGVTSTESITKAPSGQRRREPLNSPSVPEKNVAGAAQSPVKISQTKRDTIQSTRFPSAVASPLTGITIDGRLDDWPKNSERYPIANQLRHNANYNPKTNAASTDQDAYFMTGYDSRANQIYLAVVVHDKEVVVHPTDVYRTDAVEVYIDGTPAQRKPPGNPSGGWLETLDAATMPVLQYAGVPGAVSAYGDRWNANPSLVYARTRQTGTTMKYWRVGDVTTYEWSVKPFDRFPDRPTSLYPGKRLGLDVAVVDQDSRLTLVPRPPTFLTWASPPDVFKGNDASSLGELILLDSSAP